MEFLENNMQIRGKAYWAKVLQPAKDKFNPEPKYSIMLEVDDETAGTLTVNGVKAKGDNPNMFAFKRKVRSNAGKDIPPPKIYNAQGTLWGEDLIGNGSEVMLDVSFFDHGMSAQHGLGKWLNAVQVIKHIPYTASPFKPIDVETTIDVDDDVEF